MVFLKTVLYFLIGGLVFKSKSDAFYFSTLSIILCLSTTPKKYVTLDFFLCFLRTPCARCMEPIHLATSIITTNQSINQYYRRAQLKQVATP